MTDETVDRAFREHPSFEAVGDGEYETIGKPFEGTVVANETDGSTGASGGDAAVEYRVVVRAPLLDAVVEGEEVADVVQDGWYETLELRLEDVHTVAQTDAASPPEIEREGEEVVVTVTFERSDPELAAEDALAIVDYVEGTWVQGIIPGYDYREPAAGLVERATQNYDEGGAGSPSGGSPR